MADEPKTGGETAEPKNSGNNSGKVVFDSQEEVDGMVQRRIAQERRKYEEQLRDHETNTAELAKLREAERKRKEEELDEIDKYKSKITEHESEIESLKPYRERWETYEAGLKEKIEHEIESFSDEDRELVLSVPLEKQMSMIHKLKPPTDVKNINTRKGGSIKSDNLSAQEVYDIRREHGPNSTEYQKALREFKGA